MKPSVLFIAALMCPSDNPRLPFRIFPTLNFSPAAPSPGSTVILKFNNPIGPKIKLWAFFLSGASHQPEVVPVTTGMKVTIPKELNGQIYCVISADRETLKERVIVAGPGMLQFNVNLLGLPMG